MDPARCRLAGLAAVAALALTGLTACSGSQSSGAPARTAAYTTVSTATIEPGDPVPAPTGKVVLTLRGVPNTNVGRTLQFDLATLDRLGTVSYSVFDRQAEGRDVRFSGPLLSTLLDVAGARGTTLHCLALNDYNVDVPTSDATRYPVLVATRADGKRMTVAHYGPVRIIYPTKGARLSKAVYDPRWIWQLYEIHVT
jgi:hypothetical protein